MSKNSRRTKRQEKAKKKFKNKLTIVRRGLEQAKAMKFSESPPEISAT